MDDTNQKIEERITDLEKRVGILETTTNVPSMSNTLMPQKTKQLSAKEFLLSKKISSTIEKTLALAYYLEHYGQVDSFNVDDLVSVYQAAREQLPANINDMINKNIAKGHIMEVRERKDAKKAWVLTTSGDEFVENDLNK